MHLQIVLSTFNSRKLSNTSFTAPMSTARESTMAADDQQADELVAWATSLKEENVDDF